GTCGSVPGSRLVRSFTGDSGGSRANLKLSPDQIHNYAVEKSASGKCMATERRLGSDLLEERFWITSGWPTTRPKRQRPRENLTFRRAPDLTVRKRSRDTPCF